jgi:microcystin-dependent protein
MELGSIVLWSGSLITIPVGWQLCNGTNGTPDLRNKFVIGAGDLYAVNDSGGALTHDHVFTANTHSHTLAVGAGVMGGVNYSPTTDSVAVGGTTDPTSSLPPYYALAYIMKMF